MPTVEWWNNSEKVTLYRASVHIVTSPLQMSGAWDWRVEHENASGSARSDVEVVYCSVLCTALHCTLQVVLGRQNLGQVLECRVTSKALKVILTFSTVNIFFITKYFSGAHHPPRVPGRERVSLGREDVARK